MVLRNHATLLLFKVFLRLSELTGVADRRYYRHLFCLSLFLPSSCLSVFYPIVNSVSLFCLYLLSHVFYLISHLLSVFIPTSSLCITCFSFALFFSSVSHTLFTVFVLSHLFRVSNFFHLVYLFFLFNSPGRSPEELMHYPRRWRRHQRPHLR